MDRPAKQHHAISPLALLGVFLLFSLTSKAQTATTLQDVLQEAPVRAEVELTYSPEIDRYPALVQRLSANMREKMENEPFRDDGFLSLEMDYRLVAQTPRIVAVRGNGIDWSSTTHPVFLQETMVFLLQQQQWLTTSMLFPTPEGLQAISDFVCEDLRRQAIADYSEVIGNGEELEGCNMLYWSALPKPTAETFSDFLPQMDEDGLISALRFVFDSYRINGPFPRAPWDVDVPTSLLYPHLAEEYRDLFVVP